MSGENAEVLRLQDLFTIAEWQERVPWKPFRRGVDIHRLYGYDNDGPRAALLRFHPGGAVPFHEHTGYEHILILTGSQVDENSRAEAGTVIVNPPGTRHSVFSETGCVVLAIYEKPVRFLTPGTATAEAAGGLSNPSSALLAVNGTLMRGLELNSNLVDAGATFVREARTSPHYRLWSIDDRHPGMMRATTGGASISLEIWSVPSAALASILLKEPAGLSIGKVQIDDGEEVLGVLAEPTLCEGRREITAFGGWRNYIELRNS
jgi:quercetin dioxygenase-like cupin family protein/gamma-glutamylcyclotransferase (GGCT)/AIG2-like uncharacterized protein YtfP